MTTATNAILVVFLLLTPTLSLDEEESKSKTLPHGTLILRISIKNGAVICADRRISYDDGKFRDDATKIHNPVPSLVFAVAGVPYIEINDGGLPYNTIELTKSYFAKNSFENTAEFWGGLKQALFNQLYEYLNSRPYEKWPATQYPEDNNAFSKLMFFWSGGFKIITVNYIKQRPLFMEVKSATSARATTLSILGWTKVIEEIKLGNDTRFDDLRTKPILRILKDEVPEKFVSIGEALYFAKTMITESNHRAKLIGESDYHVGPAFDCASITTNDGFKWLIQAKPVARKGRPLTKL